MSLTIANSETLSSVLPTTRHRTALDTPVQSSTEASLGHLNQAEWATHVATAGFRWCRRGHNRHRARIKKSSRLSYAESEEVK